MNRFLQTRQMLLSLALVALAGTAHALSTEAATDQVRARLLAESDAVYPGQTITLGVEQRIIPHWHTYWKNPGDSGLATKIEWALPTGASAGEIQWTIPNRYTIGPITNYGYANEVTLLSTITVPTDAKIGGAFPVQATVDWLVCEEVCIPQQVQLGMELPIVAAGSAVTGERGSDLIAKARSQLPVASPWIANIEYLQDRIELKIAKLDLQGDHIKDVWFYASQWGHVVHGAPQPRRVEGDTVVIELQPGEAPPSLAIPLQGVLVITEQAGSDTIARGVSIGNQPDVAPPTTEAASITLPYALLFAFLGGIILNLMPCVFPVLSIKALSLLDHARQSPLQTRLQGVVYTLGVLASFALLAVILIALRAGGAQIGWGFQFQAPLFVLIVAYLMFAVGLSLSGVFFIGGSITGVGSSLAARSGYSGSFFTGVLATIVATPCTAPFMGAALGYALSQPAAALLAVFFSLGLGLATPYLLLSLWPRLQHALPRPGAWMERVKQVLAFPMYATAVWLVWVLAQQIGPDATVIALGGMVIIAFAAWLYANTRNGASSSRRIGSGVAAVAVLAALVGGYAGVESRAIASKSGAVAKHRYEGGGELWEEYSADRLQALRTQGAPVFLNLTAAWCITCLVNERVALSDSAVVETFKRSNVTYLKGDWTQRDGAITAILNQFGRSGVPLYVFYPGGSDSKPVVLPQILTPETVLSAVAQSTSNQTPPNQTTPNQSTPDQSTEENAHVASNLH